MSFPNGSAAGPDKKVPLIFKNLVNSRMAVQDLIF